MFYDVRELKINEWKLNSKSCFTGGAKLIHTSDIGRLAAIILPGLTDISFTSHATIQEESYLFD